MKIRKIENADIPDLIEFNKRIYAKRNMVEESISFRFFKNPPNNNLYHESLIAVNEKNEIIGQILMMHSIFRYRGIDQTAYWGMDYIVDEKYRGSPAGTILCKKALKVDYHFGVGLSETSLAIHKIFGEIIIGKISKFIRLTNLFSILNFIFPKKNISLYFKFPDVINIKDSFFVRVLNSSEIVSNSGFWNEDLLEFKRDVEFLKWRYFQYENKYLVYKFISKKNSQNSVNPITSFFVVRPIVWKKVNCLLLVDYRTSCTQHFVKILKATTKLARTLNLSAIITGCSLPSFMAILSKNYFFKFGKKMDIVTNFKEFNINNGIDQDNILITFGDSDCDFYYGNNKW